MSHKSKLLQYTISIIFRKWY